MRILPTSSLSLATDKIRHRRQKMSRMVSLVVWNSGSRVSGMAKAATGGDELLLERMSRGLNANAAVILLRHCPGGVCVWSRCYRIEYGREHLCPLRADERMTTLKIIIIRSEAKNNASFFDVRRKHKSRCSKSTRTMSCPCQDVTDQTKGVHSRVHRGGHRDGI